MNAVSRLSCIARYRPICTYFLRNGSDATPPLLFQSDQPDKFFPPFILYYSSRPIAPPLLFSSVVRFRVKFESMHRIRTNGRMDGRMDGRPHRSLLLSRTYSINSYDREVFYLSDTRAIDLSRAMEIIFIFLFFFFFFLLFLFFFLRFVTSR